ncbi:LOB domain-containing protein 38-like [Salvia hispanica]|uniref:LOB domain-containing protein 38-like n=1 Tax=Salvia hispanica TaxID=49212 RepID=UPI0020096C23|nr:LOB domain-containing protein 38-like [Salvia hispanica]
MMSCNGCRILRKGCNEKCILRESIQCMESPQSQANATLFVAKFFGRAGLISFLSSVPHSQRPALFQSLLFEACGRTVNPVNGAVGLLWTGNWHVCQSAVETVLRGGVIRPLPEFEEGSSPETNENNSLYASRDLNKRLKASEGEARSRGRKRPATPSDESETTTLESGYDLQLNRHEQRDEAKLLRLFS